MFLGWVGRSGALGALQVEGDGQREMAGALARGGGRRGDRFSVRGSTGKVLSHGYGASAPGEAP